jgi:pimeloyl-ACP methyl ester carboxylesterase
MSVPQIARLYHKLMLTLGYKHYVGQGGDWGSLILRSMALQHPEAMVGLHINFPVAPAPKVTKNPLGLLYLAMGWLTEEEKRQGERFQMFQKDNGYSKIQGTRPQTISHALSDSPIGMLAWIREKLFMGSEDYYDWDKELMITWTMIYLLSHSSGHARIYKAATDTLVPEVLEKKISGEVALGISMFPKDVAFMTRWWAEAVIAEKVTFWRVHDKGGHFPSVEVPALLTMDLTEFVQFQIPEERKKLLYGQ